MQPQAHPVNDPATEAARRDAIAGVLAGVNRRAGVTIDWRDHVGLAHTCTKLLLERSPEYVQLKVDLVHEHLITLARCARLFDPRRGFRFSTYAMRSMINHRGRYINAINHQGQTQRKPEPRAVRLDAPVSGNSHYVAALIPDPTSPDASDLAEDAGSMELLRRVLGELSAEDFGLLYARHVLAESQDAYARRVGINRGTAGRRERKLNAQLVELLGPEFGLELEEMPAEGTPAAD